MRKEQGARERPTTAHVKRGPTYPPNGQVATGGVVGCTYTHTHHILSTDLEVTQIGYDQLQPLEWIDNEFARTGQMTFFGCTLAFVISLACALRRQWQPCFGCLAQILGHFAELLELVVVRVRRRRTPPRRLVGSSSQETVVIVAYGTVSAIPSIPNTRRGGEGTHDRSRNAKGRCIWFRRMNTTTRSANKPPAYWDRPVTPGAGRNSTCTRRSSNSATRCGSQTGLGRRQACHQRFQGVHSIDSIGWTDETSTCTTNQSGKPYPMVNHNHWLPSLFHITHNLCIFPLSLMRKISAESF